MLISLSVIDPTNLTNLSDLKNELREISSGCTGDVGYIVINCQISWNNKNHVKVSKWEKILLDPIEASRVDGSFCVICRMSGSACYTLGSFRHKQPDDYLQHVIELIRIT